MLNLFAGPPFFTALLLGLNIVMMIIFTPGLRKLRLREILFISLLISLAAGGRALLTSLPGVQPVSFLVMAAGLILGSSGGYVCGLLSGLLSDLLIMPGPQTLWYCLLWGFLGALAGRLRNVHFLILAAIGFTWGFVWGWIMNLWWYTMGVAPFAFEAYLLSCAASFYFDLAHALTNAVLMVSLGGSVLKLAPRLLKKF